MFGYSWPVRLGLNSMQRQRVPVAVCLVVIMLGALLLRLNHLDQPFEDAISWRQSSVAMMADNYYRHSWNIFYPAVSWSGPEPGYQGREFQTVSYLAALLYLVFGQHDYVGRAVAIGFGVWGIFALYQLVRRIWGTHPALAAAAVMALMPGPIFVDRSFLPDPAMVALMLTSFWMLVIYLQTDRLRFLALATIVGTWGALTKAPGLIVAIPMTYTTGAILLQRGRFAWRGLIPLLVAGALALVLVGLYYLWAAHLASSYPPHHFASSGHWVWDNDNLRRWIGDRYLLHALAARIDAWSWTWPGLGLAVLGALCLIRRDARAGLAAPWLFHSWLLAGALFFTVGADEIVGQPWNLQVISPAVAALAGYATLILVRLAGRRQRLSGMLVRLLTIITLLAGLGWASHNSLADLYYPYARQSYTLGLALREASKPDDLVLTLGNAVGEPTAIYYSRRSGWVFPPAGDLVDWTEFPQDDRVAILLFDQLRAQGATWFGVVAEHAATLRQAHPTFVRHLEQTCRLWRRSADWEIYQILPAVDNATGFPVGEGVAHRE